MNIVWSIIRTAARNIPWSQVAQSTPLFVEMVGKAKEKMQAPAMRMHEDQINRLQEDNLKLSAALLEVSDRLVKLSSRVSTLTAITVASALVAISSLLVAIFK